MKPICFMIMPFGRKATSAEPGTGVATIDFNALWDRAFAPLIQELGYEAVRADQDNGSLIVTQMIERLYFADLVIADMTIPNGNVYYEVGIRHAARKDSCVLLAADWSRQLFDVAQMRTIRYPLSDGDIGEAAASDAQSAIRTALANFAAGSSPVFESIMGYPDKVDARTASTMKDTMIALAAFQGKVRSARSLPPKLRMARAKELADEVLSDVMMPSVGLAVTRLLKDSADQPSDWSWIVDLIPRLPSSISCIEEVQETLAFALSNAGKPIDAIAKLEELMETHGPTPERLGMLGGRYKRLAAEADDVSSQNHYLNKSIDAYERGMELDLNQYYCSSNLPRLYAKRNGTGDKHRGEAVYHLVLAACDRALKRSVADEWLRPTLLGAAFGASDVVKAEQLAAEVLLEGAPRWKLVTTMEDLRTSLNMNKDAEARSGLERVLEKLSKALA